MTTQAIDNSSKATEAIHSTILARSDTLSNVFALPTKQSIGSQMPLETLELAIQKALAAKAQIDGFPFLNSQTTSAQARQRNSDHYHEIQERLGGYFFGQDEGLKKGEFLVDGLIPAEGLGFCYGPPGSNKTTMMIDLCVHMAAGSYIWHGRNITPGPVIYFAIEDVSGAFRMARGLAHKHGLTVPPCNLYIPETPLDLKTRACFATLVDAVAAMAAINSSWPRFIVVYTLSDALGGADDSDQKEVKVLLCLAEQIAKKLGIFICFIHHEAKGTGNLRGSGTLKAKAYSVLKVQKDGNARGRKVIVEKLRGGPDGEQFSMILEGYKWVAPNEGELSCASLTISLQNENSSALSPFERWKRRAKGLGGQHQTAVAISAYQAIDRSAQGPESPRSEDGLYFKAVSFDHAYAAYIEYCREHDLTTSGKTEGVAKTEFRKNRNVLPRNTGFLAMAVKVSSPWFGCPNLNLSCAMKRHKPNRWHIGLTFASPSRHSFLMH